MDLNQHKLMLSPREAWRLYNKKEKNLVEIRSKRDSGRWIRGENLDVDFFYSKDRQLFALYVEKENELSKELYKIQLKVNRNMLWLSLNFIVGFLLFILPLVSLNTNPADSNSNLVVGLASVGAFILYLGCSGIIEGFSLEREELKAWRKLYESFGLTDYVQYLGLSENE